MGERRLRDALELTQLLGRRLGRLARRALGLVEPGVLDRQRHAIARELQQLRVVRRERSRRERPDVEHARHLALDHERHAEQRGDPLLTEDRVHDVRLPHVGDEHGLAIGRDATGEAVPDRDPDALLGLPLEATRCTRHELPVLLVDQEDRHGVHGEDVAEAGEQRLHQLVERQVREGRLGDRAQVTEPLDGQAVRTGGFSARTRARPHRPHSRKPRGRIRRSSRARRRHRPLSARGAAGTGADR